MFALPPDKLPEQTMVSLAVLVVASDVIVPFDPSDRFKMSKPIITPNVLKFCPVESTNVFVADAGLATPLTASIDP
jgi:hypothetical protein